MTVSTQEYANLSWHAYQTPNVDMGESRRQGHTVYKDITLDGITYKPLEHIDNKETGYQGTIYQRKDTGEIVAAHRGTQPLKEDPQDALTDAGMVFKRVNAQAADAEKLTQHALEHAKKYADKHPGTPTPEVTITGHSLGGTLAQITASKSGLHGETFNPYGAVSLNTGIPEGGNTVINHVMAADPVSAASRHFGQVRVYATEYEVKTLMLAGYSNDGSPSALLDKALVPAGVLGMNPGIAGAAGVAAANSGSHASSNFANTDEQGRPKPSVLSDPQARQRAKQYATMIEHYRSDVQMARVTLSVAGDVGAPIGNTVSQAAQYYGQAVEANARADAELSNSMVHAVKQGYDSAHKTISDGIDAAGHKAAQAYDAGSRMVQQGADAVKQGYDNTRKTISDGIDAVERKFGHSGQAEQGPLKDFPANHPDRPLYDALGPHLPEGTSREMAAKVVLDAKQSGIHRPNQIDQVLLGNNQVFVAGKTPGFDSLTDLSQKPPPLEQTVQRIDALNQHKEQQHQQYQQQQAQEQSRGGQSMSM